MNGKTHTQGGYTTALILYPILLKQVKQLNILDKSLLIAVYILTLILLFTGARWGTIYPDLDQTSKSLPLKNVFTRAINKFLHFIGSTHRSYHTHAMDLSLLLFGLPTYFVYLSIRDKPLDLQPVIFLLYVFMFSFTVAVLMHLFLDLYTLGGIHVSVLCGYILYKFKRRYNKRVKLRNFKITLAPKNFYYPALGRNEGGRLKLMLKQPFDGDFTTGSAYEEAIRNLLFTLNCIGAVVSIYLIFKGVIDIGIYNPLINIKHIF